MRERKTIIDTPLNQKTIVVDYSATHLTVATQETLIRLSNDSASWAMYKERENKL